MSYYLLLIQLVFSALALFLFWQSISYFRRMWRYKKFSAMSFPKAYENILLEINLYRTLPPTFKKKLHLLILLFIDQKEFIGVKMSVTDEMKVIIAFYASVMRLGFALDEKDLSSTIIIYPEHFIVDETIMDGGVHQDKKLFLQGQSAKGTVVLSWQDIQEDIEKQAKESVIIHEFAHELDFEDGYADGTPVLEGSRYSRWSEVFSHVFDGLKNLADEGKTSDRLSLLGHYALTNEAEFFAVCSERFFQAPRDFQEEFPHIYEEMMTFYRVNPLTDFISSV